MLSLLSVQNISLFIQFLTDYGVSNVSELFNKWSLLPVTLFILFFRTTAPLETVRISAKLIKLINFSTLKAWKIDTGGGNIAEIAGKTYAISRFFAKILSVPISPNLPKWPKFFNINISNYFWMTSFSGLIFQNLVFSSLIWFRLMEY